MIKMAAYEVESCICVYHLYKDLWDAQLLESSRSVSNYH